MEQTSSGFREIQHTADWELEAWAPDLPALLEQAARGMYTLAGVQLHPDPRQGRSLTLVTGDPESLLVKFLSELLWLAEHDSLAFDTFDLQLNGETLHAQLNGAPIAALAKEIKAVTYHNLAIQPTGRGLEVRIVFDV